MVIFFGDGATEEGVFLESLDFASLHKLRVIFVCENNDFSVYSSKLNRQNPNRNIIKMANSLGIKGFKLKDHDLINVHRSFRNIVNKIRKNPHPFLLEINTYRTLEHCGPNIDDNLSYRNQKDVKKWQKNCQIIKYKDKILKHKIATQKDIQMIDKIIHKEILEAFKYAQTSTYPNKKVTESDIYLKKI